MIPLQDLRRMCARDSLGVTTHHAVLKCFLKFQPRRYKVFIQFDKSDLLGVIICWVNLNWLLVLLKH